MTRDEWLAAKRQAVGRLHKHQLAIRIRFACGGLSLLERIMLAIQLASLASQACTIAAAPWPGTQALKRRALKIQSPRGESRF